MGRAKNFCSECGKPLKEEADDDVCDDCRDDREYDDEDMLEH